MFETPKDRVNSLKTGIHIKTIEKLYLIDNNFKIVPLPMLFEVVEINNRGRCC
jgi:hypothetical protein